MLVGTARRRDARRPMIWWRAAVARSSSRSRCRSASTTPTTTPTACAAPTRTGAGPVRLTATGLRHAGARCAAPRCIAFARRRGRRAACCRSSSNPWLLLVGVAAIAAAVALHRRAEAVRLPRARRGDGARVLRVRRHGRQRVRAARAAPAARRGGARSPSGLPAVRRPARQQRARRRDRRGRGQAHARGAHRRGRRAAARSRAASSARSSRSSGAACSQPWALLGARGGAARDRGRCGSCCTRHDPPSLVAALVGTVRFQTRAGRAARGRAVARLVDVRPCRAATTPMTAAERGGLLERQRVAAVERARARAVAGMRSSIRRGERRCTWRRACRSRAPPASSAPPSASHIGSIAPVPSARRQSRDASAVLSRRRSARPGASAGTIANSGCASQRVEERVDAVAFDDRGARRSSARRRVPRALGVVGDAGRRAHEHERRHEVGAVEREPQAQPAAHRVADVDGAAAGVADRARGRGEVRGLGTSTATRVARLASSAAITEPTSRGLGEAGHEHDASTAHDRTLPESGDDRTRRDDRVRRGRSSTSGCAAGVTDAVVAPGSRSTPLALALAARRRGSVCTSCSTSVRPRSARSALGLATRAAGGRALHVGDRGRELPPRGGRGAPRPGAADRVHRRPATRAARHRRGPDDRPDPALRRRGALVLRSRRPPTTNPAPARVARARVRARSPSRSARRPVRCTCNLPFREPLVPTGAPLVDAPGRAGGAPWTASEPPWIGSRRRPRLQRAADRDPGAPARPGRGGVGCGDLVVASQRFAEVAAWPVLADPVSGLRRGTAAISTYDALLRVPRVRASAPSRPRAAGRRRRRAGAGSVSSSAGCHRSS